MNTVHPGYNDSGYNDIFFIAIRSNGINYACTSVVVVLLKREILVVSFIISNNQPFLLGLLGVFFFFGFLSLRISFPNGKFNGKILKSRHKILIQHSRLSRFVGLVGGV